MTPPVVSPLKRMQTAVMEAWAVWSGIESGLFDALETATDLGTLCERLDFEPLALSALSRALLTTGYLAEEEDGKLVVSASGRPFVLSKSSQFIGPALSFLRTASLFEAYPRLLRGGGELALTEEDWSHASQPAPADVEGMVLELEQRVPVLSTGSRCLLTVGCGRGELVAAISARNPNLAILALETKPILANLAAQRFAANDRVAVRQGEIFEAESGFDVVLLHHVLYASGVEKAQQLIYEAAGRLNPGGLLVIVEPLGGDEEQSAFAGFMARLYFPQGEILRPEEILGLTANAELRARVFRLTDVSPQQLLVVAHR